jgi:His/Glu/Gln/Arg/opine family amino acid ABC transporter permease subunit
MSEMDWLAYLPALVQGASLTLVLTATSMIFGTAIGFPLAMMKLSRSPISRGIATVYGTLIRGLPLLVQILLVYFAMPLVTGMRLPAVVAGAVAMALYTGGFLAEVFRAGIQAVERGQMEAGRSIGFGYWPTMRLIVLPQAFRMMLPNIVNQFTITLKNTSLLSVIGVTELTMAGQNIYSMNFDTVRVLALVGVIYLVIVIVAERLSALIERKIDL